MHSGTPRHDQPNDPSTDAAGRSNHRPLGSVRCRLLEFELGDEKPVTDARSTKTTSPDGAKQGTAVDSYLEPNEAAAGAVIDWMGS